MEIKSSNLYGWRPKVEETIEDVRQGRLSQSPGPITVSKLDRIRGGWFIMDGHHRAVESIQAGNGSVSCEQNQYVPFIERPAEAHQNMLSDMVRLIDAVNPGVQPPQGKDIIAWIASNCKFATIKAIQPELP